MVYRSRFNQGWFLWLCMWSCLVIVLSISACSGVALPAPNNGTPPSHLSSPLPQASPDLIQPGVLTVGSYLQYPPQAFLDPASQRPMGFDIDLITEIAHRLGVKVSITNMEYKTLPDAVTQGEVDVAIAAIPISDTLQAKVNFVPYFKGGEALLVPRGNPLQIATLNDLCGRSVGVVQNSLEQSDLELTSASCVEAGQASIRLTYISPPDTFIDALTQKRVEATFQDLPQVDFYAMKYANLVQQAGPILNVTMEGIAVRKESVNLGHLIQVVLDTLRKDGTYNRLIKKWGLIHGALSS
ncbi:ABC transporter substrate-binding protein [Ktedonobacter robiniae]|uniref:ABC transporter substrate-binding protein n=1 Tax=Ktedonobacter robiniae TaxID=2778365 RepID=A0ABQ3UM21_9CHLR|nr:ABC transporter substrate-binding protein [Ktedonobacter robiniae]